MHDELRITGGISVKFISFRIKNKQTEKNEWKNTFCQGKIFECI